MLFNNLALMVFARVFFALYFENCRSPTKNIFEQRDGLVPLERCQPGNTGFNQHRVSHISCWSGGCALWKLYRRPHRERGITVEKASFETSQFDSQCAKSRCANPQWNRLLGSGAPDD